MIKRRPSIVISPQIQGRPNLCTVVPISTEIPRFKMPYHVELENLVLPPPYNEGPNWVKADMIFASSFSRLELIRTGKDESGKRIYITECLCPDDLNLVRKAMLCSLGLSSLTKHMG
jgi:mRNA interferase MazF